MFFNIGKKIVLIIFSVIILIFFGLSYVLPYMALGQDIDYKKLDIVYDVNEDGTAIVHETYKVNYKKASGCFYKMFYTDDNTYYDGSDITIIGAIVDGVDCIDFGREISYLEYDEYIDDPVNSKLPVNNNFYEYDNYSEKEIGVWFERKKCKREITLIYKIDNFIKGYEDTAVLYSQLVGDKGAYLGEIRAEINLPCNAEKGWLHHKDGRDIRDSYIDMENPNKIILTGKGNRAGNYFETRILLPLESFHDLENVSTKSIKKEILEEEQVWYDKYQKEQSVVDVCAIIDYIIFSLLVSLILVLITLLLFKTKKYVVQRYEYYRNMPKDIDTANLGYLYYYYKGGLKRKNKDKIISGALLDFVRRGYLYMHDDGSFEINQESDYVKLSRADYTLFSIFKQAAELNESKNIFKVEDISKICSSTFEARKLEKNLKLYFEEASYFNFNKLSENKTRIHKTTNLLPIFLLGASFFMFIFLGMLFTFTATALLIGGLVLGFISYSRVPKLTKLGEEYRQQILGLSRYLKDFSNLEDHDVVQLVVWEQYMVYATIMGISEKVIDKLKVKCPEIFEHNNDTNRDSYLYHLSTPYYLQRKCLTHSVHSSFSHIYRTINRVGYPSSKRSSSRRRRRRSGGSGRGYSGGGGGGGGGGFGSR